MVAPVGTVGLGVCRSARVGVPDASREREGAGPGDVDDGRPTCGVNVTWRVAGFVHPTSIGYHGLAWLARTLALDPHGRPVGVFRDVPTTVMDGRARSH